MDSFALIVLHKKEHFPNSLWLHSTFSMCFFFNLHTFILTPCFGLFALRLWLLCEVAHKVSFVGTFQLAQTPSRCFFFFFSTDSPFTVGYIHLCLTWQGKHTVTHLCFQHVLSIWFTCCYKNSIAGGASTGGET